MSDAAGTEGGQREITLEQIVRQQGLQIRLQRQKLQNVTTYTLLAIFVLVNVATIVLFFLNGFGITELSDVAMASLVAATIAEVAGLLVIIMKGLFSM